MRTAHSSTVPGVGGGGGVSRDRPPLTETTLLIETPSTLDRNLPPTPDRDPAENT